MLGSYFSPPFSVLKNTVDALQLAKCFNDRDRTMGLTSPTNVGLPPFFVSYSPLSLSIGHPNWLKNKKKKQKKRKHH